MIQESVVGKITDINETGVASIKAIVPDMNRAVLRKYSTVHIIFDDGRRISCTQRRKCYALLGEIAEYTDGIRTADTVDEQKRLLKTLKRHYDWVYVEPNFGQNATTLMLMTRRDTPSGGRK